MERNELINRISYFRTQANLSARALSQKIAMNEGYINRLESKKDFLPSLEVLFEIIRVCNATIEEFFYHDITAYKQDIVILNSLKSLKYEKKQTIITLIDQLK